MYYKYNTRELNDGGEQIIKKFRFKKGDLTVIISLMVMHLWYSFFGCPIKWLFGIACTGCGMSRALVCLLEFDFCGAWKCHPLIYIMPLVVIVYLCRAKICKTCLIIFYGTVFMLFIVVYVWRLYNGDPITQVDFYGSALFRLCEKIFN